MAIVTLPELLNDPKYPDDVKEKARLFLADCKGNSIGKFETEKKLIIKQLLFVSSFFSTPKDLTPRAKV
jgi:hypothetical protein